MPMNVLEMLEAMSATPDPADPVVTITLAGAKELLKLLDDGRPEALDDRLHVNELRAAIDQEQPELWGTWHPGPNEFHPSLSKEAAEKDRVETLDAIERIRHSQGDECKGWPETVIDVCRSPLEPESHWQELAESQTFRAENLVRLVGELQREIADLKGVAQP